MIEGDLTLRYTDLMLKNHLLELQDLGNEEETPTRYEQLQFEKITHKKNESSLFGDREEIMTHQFGRSKINFTKEINMLRRVQHAKKIIQNDFIKTRIRFYYWT